MREKVKGAFVTSTTEGGWKRKYLTCSHFKKANHIENLCWFGPGVKRRACNQPGHVENVCKNRANKPEQHAQVVELHENNSKGVWFIESGCTNHMTHEDNIFNELPQSNHNRKLNLKKK